MILERCIEIIEKEKNCDEFEEKESCLQCVKDSFYFPNRDTYNCLKKLATYTIEYGAMYASEIYHFLEQSKLLEKYFNNERINILSLGCGFMPDSIALRDYIENKKLDIDFLYKGYDIEPLWNQINSKNFETKDIINGFDCKGIDIIFMNKVFSTLVNHQLSDKFLDTFEKELQSLTCGSLVVFNDINRWNMGRDEFNSFAINNSLECIGKYFFNRDEYSESDYIEIQNKGNRYRLPNNLPFEPRNVPTKTVFFLYRKK